MVAGEEEDVGLFVMMVDDNGLYDNSTVADDSDDSIDLPSLIYDDDSSNDRDSMPALEQHGCFWTTTRVILNQATKVFWT